MPTRLGIVDGDDGRIYIIKLTGYGFICVTEGNMKFSHDTILPRHPQFDAVLALFAASPSGSQNPSG
jgi:hypothetical protein